MVVLVYVLGFSVAAVASLYLTRVVRDLAVRRNWVDIPGQRSVHSHITPRVGGLAVVAACIAGFAIFQLGHLFLGIPAVAIPVPIALGAVAMAAVGFTDDLKELHYRYKFLFQTLIAVVFVSVGYRITAVSIPVLDSVIVLPAAPGFVISVLWIVTITNAINLLDGMDGLAAGVSMIALFSLAFSQSMQGDLANLALILAILGAVSGFLVHNFNPASIFMGDTGSLFLGFLVATISMRDQPDSDSILAFMIPVIALGLPLMDTSLAIVRRFLEKRPLFQPDRDHIHHRLAKTLHLSQRRTVVILYVFSAILGLAAFLLSVSERAEATFVLVVTGVTSYLFLRQLGYLRISHALRYIHPKSRKARNEAESVHSNDPLPDPDRFDSSSDSGNGQPILAVGADAPEPLDETQ